ncbi:CIA30 family protein [Pseudoalteromonas phenolica]|uniref:CIA30 family protein n=1 Tax=Pseudoalteromonas phenolica TaxID=161398 RepID=UPI00110AEE83|nr:CIA30 family protein [Pseudoalteromonas phenolica]TMO54741.1 CIA30 family protein [Pseudoalteromonas phenolica]
MTSSSVIAETKLTLLDWFVVNDTVMGGLSESRLVVGTHSVEFKGDVSLRNNGGFASVRAPFNLENKNAEQLSVVVKGDGKQYQLRLRVDQYLDGPAFVYKFQTSVNKTQTLVVTEDDFTLMYRGRTFYADYQLNFDDVRSLGFMISEKQAGKFSLEVQAITPLGKI